MSAEHNNLKRLAFTVGVVASVGLANDFMNDRPVSRESLKIVLSMTAEQESPGAAIVYSSESIYLISGSVDITPQTIMETAILSGAIGPKKIHRENNQTNESQSNKNTNLPNGNPYERAIPEETKLPNKKGERV